MEMVCYHCDSEIPDGSKSRAGGHIAACPSCKKETGICVECGAEFDPNSEEKRAAGGKVHQCPDCAHDPHVPYLGLRSGSGKMSDLTILAFGSEEARSAYHFKWAATTGQFRGKSCQLGGRIPMVGRDAGFRIVGENRANANHKGKA